MNLSSLIQNAWTPCVWTFLSCAGIIGLVALLSPKTFAPLAIKGSRWLDSEKILAWLDRRVDVDHFVLPYSRFLGAAVVATVAILSLRLRVH